MRFTPRKEEIERIVSILESDDYDSGESMAKALLLEIVDMLWFRDWWVLASRGSDYQVVFGPFASEAEARAVGQKWQGVLMPGDPMGWGVVQVHGLGGTAEERAGGGFGYCSAEDCGHPAYGHSMAGTSRGKCLLCKGCSKYEQQVKGKRATRKKATA